MAKPHHAARSPCATAKAPAHKTSHLRAPQQPAFGPHPSQRHNTVDTKQRWISKALHRKGGARKTGESPRDKHALGSGNWTEHTQNRLLGTGGTCPPARPQLGCLVQLSICRLGQAWGWGAPQLPPLHPTLSPDTSGLQTAKPGFALPNTFRPSAWAPGRASPWERESCWPAPLTPLA